MRYLTFTHEWRETGKYNNLMYGVAAAVVEAMEGEQWETVAYRRLLHPLNMRSTAFISSLDTAQHNFAASYSEDDSGTLKQLSIDIAR
jgi:CubicO group peptidase (beta-lactamase class C family)